MYVKIFTSQNVYNFNVNIAKKIGFNLKLARKSNGMTQKVLANKLLMTQQQYSRFENGIFELNYSQIIAICKILNISPNDLFEIDD